MIEISTLSHRQDQSSLFSLSPSGPSSKQEFGVPVVRTEKYFFMYSMAKRIFCFVAFTALEKKKKVNREPRAIKDCLSLRPHTYLTFTLYSDVCFRALFEHYLS